VHLDRHDCATYHHAYANARRIYITGHRKESSVEVITRKKWFIKIAIIMSWTTFYMTTFHQYSTAAVIPSQCSNLDRNKNNDLEKAKIFLEKKIVKQRLIEYGVSAEVAFQKIQNLNDKELHMLASVIDRIPNGGAQNDYSGLNDYLKIAAIVIVAIVVGIVYLFIAIGKAVAGDKSYENTDEKMQTSE